MRGEIFTIDGLKFFAFGGGVSIDRAYRIEFKSWWSQEIPNYSEIENGFVNLEKNNNTVDYVLTHSAPSNISLEVVESHHCETDQVTRMLDEFEKVIKYKKWFFGHHHIDKNVDEKHWLLYNRVMKLE
jgi:hypothetical protein